MEGNKIIKAMRIHLGMTQTEAAEKIGILLEDYQKYEDCDGYIMNGKFSEVCRIIEVMQLNPQKFYREMYVLEEKTYQEMSLNSLLPPEQQRSDWSCPVAYLKGRNRNPKAKMLSADLK